MFAKKRLKRYSKKFVRKIKRINSRYHVKHTCKKCPLEKRLTRDLRGTGECFWYESWRNGCYDIPWWMGFKNYFRMKFLKKPMIIKMEGQLYLGKPPFRKRLSFKNRSLRFTKIFTILKKKNK